MSTQQPRRNRRRLQVGIATALASLALVFGVGGTASAADGNSIASTAEGQLGHGCGDYYGCPAPGEWCAEFSKWVWQQNGVDVSDLNAAAAFRARRKGP